MASAVSAASGFELKQYEFTVSNVRRNLSLAALNTEAIREDLKCNIADKCALIAFSGEKTGRSPNEVQPLHGKRRRHRNGCYRTAAAGPKEIT